MGVDGSAGAAAAVAEVAARYWPWGSEARVVNAAWTIPPVAEAEVVGHVIEWIAQENARVRKLVEEAADKLLEAGLRVSTVVREQEPKSLLCAEAESMQADCIFVGAQGLGRLERVLAGSVSAGVAARAFRALAEKGINIRAITTSEIKFSVLIDAAYTELAVRTLHSLYGLDAG